VLPKIAVAVPSKGALKVLPKTAIGNFSGGRNRQGALEVLPNANEFLKTTEVCHSVSPVGVSPGMRHL